MKMNELNKALNDQLSQIKSSSEFQELKALEAALAAAAAKVAAYRERPEVDALLKQHDECLDALAIVRSGQGSIGGETFKIDRRRAEVTPELADRLLTLTGAKGGAQ